jgi:hypothetical protein
MDRPTLIVPRSEYRPIPDRGPMMGSHLGVPSSTARLVSMEGGLLMTLSAACFATNALLIKLLGARYAASSLELVWVRGITAMVINCGMLHTGGGATRVQASEHAASNYGTADDSSSGNTVATNPSSSCMCCIGRMFLPIVGNAATTANANSRGIAALSVPMLLAMRAAFGFCGVACDYYAIVHLPLPVSSVLIFTSPVWASFIAHAGMHVCFTLELCYVTSNTLELYSKYSHCSSDNPHRSRKQFSHSVQKRDFCRNRLIGNIIYD